MYIHELLLFCQLASATQQATNCPPPPPRRTPPLPFALFRRCCRLRYRRRPRSVPCDERMYSTSPPRTGQYQGTGGGGKLMHDAARERVKRGQPIAHRGPQHPARRLGALQPG